MISTIVNKSAAAVTMTSREIAELTEKRHDNVMRTIETLYEKSVIELPQFEEVPNVGLGPLLLKQYRIGKRDSFVVVAQLSPEFTARLVDRWQELEAKAAPAIPQTLSAALRLAADQADQIEAQQVQLAIAEPKALALDRIADADGSMCITDAAKHLQMAPKKLFSWLSANDWIYRRPGAAHWVAYQPRLKSGVLDHKITLVTRGDGSEKVTEQVLVTAKGLARLAGVAA